MRLLFLFFIPLLNFSQSFFVSHDGNDKTGDGTINFPYNSIQKAIDEGASEILLLEGVYDSYEIITGSDLVIKPYLDNNVVFNGTITINNPGIVDAEWVQHSDNIFKTYIEEDIWQLFIDDEQMVMARWPNSSFENDLIYNKNYWAHSQDEDLDGVVNDITEIDSLSLESKNLSDFSNEDISGATLIANFGSFKTKIRTVSSNGLDIENNKFEYFPIGNEYRDKHHYYFLEGKLAFLDSSNEWFYENGVLYLWSPNGDISDIENKIIRGKNKTFSFNFLNSNNITFQGFKFFASTATIQNSNNITITNNVFSYPSYSKRMLGDTTSPFVTNIDQNLDTGILPSNSNSSGVIFSNNVFEYTDGEALILAGDNHTIENNYFHHIDWSCAETQAIGLTIYCNGSNIEFNRNIIHTTGASATLNLGARANISYNDISNTGLAQSDGAVVQITKNIVEGSETSYNWIHDTEKMGFRFDAPVGSAETAGTEGLAHHNVIWNIGKNGFGGIGMMIKGDYHEIYNNTVFNCDKTDILILDEDGLTNLDTYTENNAADIISNHRTNDVDSENLIPGFKSNNYSLFSDHSSNNTQTIDPLLVTSVQSINYDPLLILENRYLYDFTPNDSLLINQGKIINTLEDPIQTHPNVVQLNVTENYQGDFPDIGAYEFGSEFWIPGITFEPTTYPWAWPINNIFGCTDATACNYDPNATDDDNTCVYSEEFYDCDGNCINDTDGDEICDELELVGCTDTTACNYDPNATDDDSTCLYAEDYYDCDGNCINDIDEDEICDELDNCEDVFNPNQEDLDNNGVGDDCETTNIFENNSNKTLVKITDLVGRVIESNQLNLIELYFYDDGTIVKKIIIN